MTTTLHRLIPPTFTPIPSRDGFAALTVQAQPTASQHAQAIGFPVAVDGDVAPELGLDRQALTNLGFDGKVGQTYVAVHDGAAVVAVGIGDLADLGPAELRDASAAFARATETFSDVALHLTRGPGLDAERAGQAATEGAILARYRYTVLKTDPKSAALTRLELLVPDGDQEACSAGITRGLVLAEAAALARDLANTPPAHLTATAFADLALRLGPQHGLDVQVFDKAQLIELGCGGLLGVNAGSIEEPRMIQLRYRPQDPTGHLALVGKGIMYDSGGISLKPSNAMHLAMKMDMSGAAAVFATLMSLSRLGCGTAVTGYLMCTDNLPSGSALNLGDVLTIRNGTTVEVKNTDAEGRLVMSDALALAAEETPDAIVDIATLTGAALMALGPSRAALLGNDQPLIDAVRASSEVTDEPVWQLPLEKVYRKQLDSDVADISNLGGDSAGATTAALFLAEFVGSIPWAHLDIAGTMQTDKDDSWRSKGATGFGTRLLIDFATSFTSPRP